MKTLIVGFFNEESGATAVEYGLIVTLISVALIREAPISVAPFVDYSPDSPLQSA